MAAAGPPPAVHTFQSVQAELPNIGQDARAAYAGRIDTAAHEALIADAIMYTARTRAAYDHLVVVLGYASTKPAEAPRPANWRDDFICSHGFGRTPYCCADSFDISQGDWRWGLSGKRALAAPTRITAGTFPATRSIYLRVLTNLRCAHERMGHVVWGCSTASEMGIDDDDYDEAAVSKPLDRDIKNAVRGAFIAAHAAEVLCARFVHLHDALPSPRAPRALVVVPRMRACEFGYTHINAKHKTVYTECPFNAPVQMEAHGDKHSCARHAAIPAGWIDYDGMEKYQKSITRTFGAKDSRAETAGDRMKRDAANGDFVAANRRRVAARRRVRVARGILQVERRRKMARRGMEARGLNEPRLIEYIIAMAEDVT